MDTRAGEPTPFRRGPFSELSELPRLPPPYGEGGIRTRDTTIFSRVLYQLSYLAWERGDRALHREG